MNKFHKQVPQKTLMVAEKQYYNKLLIKSNFKMSNGSTTTDKKSISEHFHDFFINICLNLAKSIPRVNKKTCLLGLKKLFSLRQSHLMKPKQLCHHWRIMPQVLIKSMQNIWKSLSVVANLLVYICNMSLRWCASHTAANSQYCTSIQMWWPRVI